MADSFLNLSFPEKDIYRPLYNLCFKTMPYNTTYLFYLIYIGNIVQHRIETPILNQMLKHYTLIPNEIAEKFPPNDVYTLTVLYLDAYPVNADYYVTDITRQ